MDESREAKFVREFRQLEEKRRRQKDAGEESVLMAVMTSCKGKRERCEKQERLKKESQARECAVSEETARRDEEPPGFRGCGECAEGA